MSAERNIRSVPRTRQLAQELEKEITAGIRGAGTLLPSIRELAEERGVGPSSALGAYRLLERKGLVVREAGRGTFVAGNERPPVEPGVRIYTWDQKNFQEELLQVFKPQGEVFRFESTNYRDYPRYLDWLNRRRRQTPGLVVLDEYLLQVASAEGLLEPLDELLEGTDTERYLATFAPSCRRALCRDGRCYALPISCLPTMAYFNRRVFREIGVPLPKPEWSWEDFFELLDPLTRYSSDGRLERGAVGLMLDSNGCMPLLSRYGGELFDRAGNCAIGSEAFFAGIRDFMRLYTHPGCCVHKMGDRRDALGRLLVAGRLGLVIGNELDAAVVRRELPPGDFQELRLPGTIRGGHFTTLPVRGVGILAGTPNPAELFRELEILYQPENINRLCAAGEHIPAETSTTLSPETEAARNTGRPVCQHPNRIAEILLHELLFELLWHQMPPSFGELVDIERQINRRLRSR